MKFGVGDVVLLWNKNKENPNNHGKLEKLGMGPYRVSRITSKGSVVGNIGGLFVVQEASHLGVMVFLFFDRYHSTCRSS